MKALLQVYYLYFVYHSGALAILAFCKGNFEELAGWNNIISSFNFTHELRISF